MRVVSLNLDLGDVVVLRRALGHFLAACSCAEGGAGRDCSDCKAMAAMMAELDRLVSRPLPRRATPTVDGVSPVVQSPYTIEVFRAGRAGAAEPRLRLLPGDFDDRRPATEGTTGHQ